TRVATYDLGAVAPIDRPTGDRVSTWIRRRQTQRVGRSFVDIGRAADRQSGCYIKNRHENRAARAKGSIFICGRAADRVVPFALTGGLSHLRRVAVYNLGPVAPIDRPTGDRVGTWVR